ncbi:MAG: hypothetical protein ACI9S8_001928 [Chlamydiales bacterium]|jgi:hypothetical protein
MPSLSTEHYAANPNTVICKPPYPSQRILDSRNSVFARVKSGMTRWLDTSPIYAAVTSVGLAALGALSKSLCEYNSNQCNASTMNSINAIVYPTSLFLMLGLCHRWKHLPTSLILEPISKALNLPFDFRKNMKEKVYEERSCIDEQGNVLGKVYYTKKDGNQIPVFEAMATSPKDKGFAQGLLLAHEINDLYDRALSFMLFLIKTQDFDLWSEKIHDATNNLNIPEEQLLEMEGIVDGMREYARRNQLPMKVSIDQLIEVHVLADTYKKVFFEMGCSAIIAKKGKEACVARTHDWISLGLLGQYTIINKQKGVDSKTGRPWSTETMSFPGYLGTITGTNGKLTAVLNELGGISYQQGIPETLITTLLLRQAETVDEAEELLQSWLEKGDANILPASSSNIILVDSTGMAKVFHMYAQPGRFFVSNTYDQDGILVVTNHAIDDDGKVIPGSASGKSSERRWQLLKNSAEVSLSRNFPIKDIVRNALKQEGIDVAHSVGAVIYSMGKEEVEIDYAFDNYYSASHL